MKSLSFSIDIIINEIQCEEALVDNGCQSYGTTSDKFISKHNPIGRALLIDNGIYITSNQIMFRKLHLTNKDVQSQSSSCSMATDMHLAGFSLKDI